MNAVERYLAAVDGDLRLSRRHRRDIVAELRDGLHDDVDHLIADGLGRAEAERTAVAGFGDPRSLAAEYRPAAALRAARRAAMLGVLLLPLIDVGWMVTPGHPGSDGTASLRIAVLALATKVIGFAGAAWCGAALVRARRRRHDPALVATRLSIVCLVGVVSLLCTAGVLTISNLTAVHQTFGPPPATLLWLASGAGMAAFTASTVAALRLTLPRSSRRLSPTP